MAAMNYQLERTGNLCKLMPWLPALERRLSYTRLEMDYTEPKARPLPVVEHLYFLAEDKQAGFFPAGLLPEVQRHLTENGLHYMLVDRRDLEHLYPQPQFDALDPLRPGQDQVILAVCENDRGIIVCSTGAGKSHLIRQICKMYPGLKIVITTPGRDDVRNMYKELNAIMPAHAVGMIGGGRNDSPNHRITVCTNKSLRKADLENCDVFIFDEVHACGHNDVADVLAWVRNARMFGFTASPKGRSDNAEKVIEALFGGVIAEFNYQEAAELGLVAPIEVWEYTAGGKTIDSVMQASKKRWAYWRNRERNELIAKIARRFPADEQVLILVETIEHLMYLKKLLPEFTAVYSDISDIDYLSYKDSKCIDEAKITPKLRDQYREQFMTGELKKVLATGVWKQSVDFKQLAVLIRADGAPGEIASTQIPGRLSRIAEGKEKGILIDFFDGYDPWTLGRSRKRVASYRAKGWNIIRKELTDEAKVSP